MAQPNNRHIIVALLGCVGLLLVALLLVTTLVGGLVVVALRAPGPLAHTTATALAARNARPVPPYVPATATAPPTATPTAIPLTTRERPSAAPAAALRATPGAAPALQKVDLPVNDLAYDPFAQRLWASVPSSAGDRGNSVVPIDPTTGALGEPLFIGSEPNRLALSDNGQFLYVALHGSGDIRQVDLRTGKVEQTIALGTDRSGRSYYPADLAVMPGKPEAIAVVRTTDPSRQGSPSHDVAIFIDGTQLPDTVSGIDGDTIQFCGDAGTLYAYQNLSSGYRLLRLAVDSAGVHQRDAASGLISGYWVTIRCDAGRLYASSGQVIDASSRALTATFQGLSGNTMVSADATVGRVFFLTQVNGGAVGWPSNDSGRPLKYRVLAFDHRTFRQVWALDLAELDSLVPNARNLAQLPRALVRWGAAGLAFRASPTQVYIVQAPEVGGAAGASATPAITSAQTPPGPPPRPSSATPSPPTAPSPPPTATPPRPAGTISHPSARPAQATPRERLSNVATLPAQGKSAWHVAWSPDGKILAAADSEKTAWLWHADGRLLATLTGHTTPIIALAWAPDSSRLATASASDGDIRLWAANGAALATLPAHPGGVATVAWSPNGQLLASSGGDRTVRLWSADGAPVTTMKGMVSPVQHIAWAPDSSALAFAPGDSSVRVWNTAGAILATFDGHRGPAITELGWSPRGDLLASSDSNGNLLLWRPEGILFRTLVGPVNATGSNVQILDLAWAPDGETLATLNATGSFELWKTDGTPGPSRNIGARPYAGGTIAWSPNSTVVGAAMPQVATLLLNVRDGSTNTIAGDPGAVNGLAWSPDGKTLATAMNDGTIQLWR